MGNVTVLPPGTLAPDLSQAENGVIFAGTLKSFTEEKGWGFITGPEVQRIFQKDIFIHKREFDGSPSPGAEVHFTVYLDGACQPVAKRIKDINSAINNTMNPEPVPEALPDIGYQKLTTAREMAARYLGPY